MEASIVCWGNIGIMEKKMDSGPEGFTHNPVPL